VTLSYNISRNESTNRVPWTVFYGSPPLQYYYTEDETPFWNLTPFQREQLEQSAPSLDDWNKTYQSLCEKRAELTTYVQSRHLSRANRLIEQSEKQLDANRLSVGASVKVRRELPNRHGAVRQRKKFDAPIHEELGTIVEYTKSNRYLVQFPDGTKKHYSRRWLKLISTSNDSATSDEDEAAEQTQVSEKDNDSDEEQLTLRPSTSGIFLSIY
jgi:hypothetical protein